MRPTFHLVPADDWAATHISRPYAAPSLAAEGFIHCTDGESELIATANRHYRDDQRPYVALTVDLDEAGSPWTVKDPGRIYPHVHGPIARAAILDARPMLRDPDGRFVAVGRPGPVRPAVHLRPYVDGDRWLTEAIEADAVMMAELGGPLPLHETPRIHARRLEGIAADRLWYYTVVLEPGDQVVGTICLWSDKVDGERRSEAGWATLPAFQGRGIATEALRLMLERARDDGRWGDIHAYTGAANGPSNALCRAAGFRDLGRETVSYAGRDLDCNHWVLPAAPPATGSS